MVQLYTLGLTLPRILELIIHRFPCVLGHIHNVLTSADGPHFGPHKKLWGGWLPSLPDTLTKLLVAGRGFEPPIFSL